MDKNIQEAKDITKTQTSYNIELLARLIVSDASFLTLREKLIFLEFLLKDDEGNPFPNEKAFEERFLSLTITSVSLAVKRVFPRAKWTSSESLKKVLCLLAYLRVSAFISSLISSYGSTESKINLLFRFRFSSHAPRNERPAIHAFLPGEP